MKATRILLLSSLLISAGFCSAETQIECKLLKKQKGKKPTLIAKQSVPILEKVFLNPAENASVKAGLLPTKKGLSFYIELSYDGQPVAFTETSVGNDEDLKNRKLELVIPQTEAIASCQIKAATSTIKSSQKIGE